MSAVAKVLVLVILVGVAGCGQFDDTAAFKVVNDGKGVVTVTMCGSTCQQMHESQTVKVGAVTEFNATVGGPAEDFLIRGGGEVRCLTVLVPHGLVAPLVVPVSSARPCTPHQMRRGSWWDRHFS